MKPVRLIDFFKRLDEQGVDLKGCYLKDVNKRYKFIGIVQNKVWVRYGPSLDKEGAMTNLVQVVGMSMDGGAKRRLGACSKNGSITVKFKDWRMWD